MFCPGVVHPVALGVAASVVAAVPSPLQEVVAFADAVLVVSPSTSALRVEHEKKNHAFETIK